MSNQLAEARNVSPAEMIQQAVSGGADLEKLEKLLSIQERWESNEAKKAYHKSMADFKADPPKIIKDRQVGYESKGGKVGYRHATLGNVTEKVSEALSKHGLSASWTTRQNGQVEVTCRITHCQGHSEETTLSAPADTTGSKNSIQAIGSTITYLERYTLLALTGLATYDQDDDGVSSEEVKYISEEQQHQIRDSLISAGLEKSEAKFLKFMGVEKIELIKEADFNKAIKAIEAKKKPEGKKK